MMESVQLLAALDTGLGDAANKMIVNLIMLVILALPLFSTPILMKLMGGIASQIGGIVNNRGKGVFDRTRNLGRKLSDKQVGAWKGLARRKGTEYAAEHYKPGSSWAHPKNLASMAATGKPGFTRRQRIAMGSTADQYESEQLKMAEQYFSQRGISGQKEALLAEAGNEKNDFYTRLQAARMAADAGAVYELENMFNGSQNVRDAAGNRITYSDTEKMRDIAAKAASKSSKVNEKNSAFADAALKYDTAKKAGYSDEDTRRADGTLVKGARTQAREEHRTKLVQKMNAAYIMNQKPDRHHMRAMAEEYDSIKGRGAFHKILEEATHDPALNSRMGDIHKEILARAPGDYAIDDSDKYRDYMY